VAPEQENMMMHRDDFVALRSYGVQFISVLIHTNIELL
jgi:hypothetical protein